MFSAALYARVQLSLHYSHTRPRVQRASGIPCALSFSRGATLRTNLERIALRDRKSASVAMRSLKSMQDCQLCAAGELFILGLFGKAIPDHQDRLAY
ncbi:hypothetical protein JQ597_20200 [Bradyrhizobium sp. AUGA SZCCT0177]|uniref:hypothetical protein n=1 Tax=unclassified Bradyrhizobium TaxID=2631580 RepID=UPI001BA85975|nr:MULTISPECIES: hypothetical protein [unclassified Bradyrhizobium]MBR1230746.1 hypothetical protein [Bradyrhizobium sp. AUGA SZCCT0182]MBR1284375.1 hypothetical protein [Bradyrhizobium sp. AUGA SZCCT0177]